MRTHALLPLLTIAGLFLIPATSDGWSGALPGDSPATGSVPVSSQPDGNPTPVEPVPALAAPEFVGSYRPDGRFRARSRLDTPAGPAAAEIPRQQRARRPEVPPSIDLGEPSHKDVEQLSAVHARSSKPVERKSGAASFFESIVVFAYGHQPVLHSPTHVTTDSRERLIVSDPAASAVHVLEKDRSFRIAGGPGRTLQDPAGVAVDAGDNIYVADRKRGLVLVFDPQGRFLRCIGLFKGESIFQEPTAIALDRAAGRLFVLDSPANELIVFDLRGNVLRRVGGNRKINGVSFDLPTEIAVRGERVVVIDALGTRVQVLDLECRFLRAFQVNWVSGRPSTPELGLALDSASNIYIGHLVWPTLRIYDQRGHLLTGFGQKDKDYSGTSGMWVDTSDRIYVADSVSSRIQVFQHRSPLPTPKSPSPAPASPAGTGSQ